MLPPVTEHVPLHSKSLCKSMARASGGANNMHPLSWGGGTKDPENYQEKIFTRHAPIQLLQTVLHNEIHVTLVSRCFPVFFKTALYLVGILNLN